MTIFDKIISLLSDIAALVTADNPAVISIMERKADTVGSTYTSEPIQSPRVAKYANLMLNITDNAGQIDIYVEIFDPASQTWLEMLDPTLLGVTAAPPAHFMFPDVRIARVWRVKVVTTAQTAFDLGCQMY